MAPKTPTLILKSRTSGGPSGAKPSSKTAIVSPRKISDEAFDELWCDWKDWLGEEPSAELRDKLRSQLDDIVRGIREDLKSTAIRPPSLADDREQLRATERRARNLNKELSRLGASAEDGLNCARHKLGLFENAPAKTRDILGAFLEAVEATLRDARDAISGSTVITVGGTKHTLSKVPGDDGGRPINLARQNALIKLCLFYRDELGARVTVSSNSKFIKFCNGAFSRIGCTSYAEVGLVDAARTALWIWITPLGKLGG